MKIKICGITRKEDALLAAKLGAWALGFIFVEKTPRYITPKNVAEIITEISLQNTENPEKIGVFANISAEKILEITSLTGISKIQLHGEESPEFCEKLANLTKKEIIKAFRIQNADELHKISEYKNKISYALLDSFCPNQLGGTGKVFDWEIAKTAKNIGISIILAGGLTPENAKQAFESVNPYALDISSGVEKDKGIKDSQKLKKLFI
jgi:phosphoribosylanthranilate isomerase